MTKTWTMDDYNQQIDRVLAEAVEFGHDALSVEDIKWLTSGIGALRAEIARLNGLLNDINAAWQADRLTRLDGDKAIYELHEADKARS